MPRLKNRQLQIPNGLGFYLPEVKWRAPRGASFNMIVDALSRVVRANPALAQKHQWPTDPQAIADWVDLYNATVCVRMGWTGYIMDEGGGASLPKSSAPHQQATLQSLRNAAAVAKALVRGAKTLHEYIESGEPPVPPEQSLSRATVCAVCPKNEPGDFTKWFTIPAAEQIQRLIERAHSRKLTTPRDEDLNICVACHCPMKLKVHIPIAWIVARTTPEEIADLRGGKNCWILAEAGL